MKLMGILFSSPLRSIKNCIVEVSLIFPYLIDCVYFESYLAVDCGYELYSYKHV